MEQQKIEKDMALERSIFLSDGVFAIAITLLVLEINVPEIPPAEQATQLSSKLLGLWIPTATYILSFIILGVYWMSHQRIFHYIQRSDSVLAWINIFFLMTVAFLPIPTRVLGMYGDHQPAVIFYIGSLMITGIFIITEVQYNKENRQKAKVRLEERGLANHVLPDNVVSPLFTLSRF